MTVNIRIATTKDAARLLEIYAYYVQYTAVTFEDALPTVEEFAQRIENVLLKFPYLVAEDETGVIGYAYASLFRQRSAYRFSVEMSIYLDHTKRHKGVGKKLYLSLEEKLKGQGVVNLCVVVASSGADCPYVDGASEKFHEKLGYQVAGKLIKNGYKFNQWFDIIFMVKQINAPVFNQPEMIYLGEFEK